MSYELENELVLDLLKKEFKESDSVESVRADELNVSYFDVLINRSMLAFCEVLADQCRLRLTITDACYDENSGAAIFKQIVKNCVPRMRENPNKEVRLNKDLRVEIK